MKRSSQGRDHELDVPAGAGRACLHVRAEAAAGAELALAANGNLCSLTKTVLVKRKVTVRVKGRKKTVTRNVRQTLPAALAMPTVFTAQNGTVIKQNTQISVTGCPKSKKPKSKTKGKKKK